MNRHVWWSLSLLVLSSGWMQFINAETEEEFLQEMGETKEHVLFRLKEKFKLSDTDANQYLEKYWKE